jgi:hypothetical protein
LFSCLPDSFTARIAAMNRAFSAVDPFGFEEPEALPQARIEQRAFSARTPLRRAWQSRPTIKDFLFSRLPDSFTARIAAMNRAFSAVAPWVRKTWGAASGYD